MNERIKELKKQAWEYAMAVHDGHLVPQPGKATWPMDEVYDEKFAELIVRECAGVVFKKTGPKSALDVLEHFGVEE